MFSRIVTSCAIAVVTELDCDIMCAHRGNLDESDKRETAPVPPTADLKPLQLSICSSHSPAHLPTAQAPPAPDGTPHPPT